MIFSEWYGAYFNAVAKILKAAAKQPVTKQQIRAIVKEEAFSESILAIEPALLTGRWPLLRPDGTSVLHHAPDMPLTLLEKRFLKAILLDKRMRLFECEIEGLEGLKGVEPLFEPEDIFVFDQYADGDPYTDEDYIRHFRQILRAVKEHSPLSIDVVNRHGGCTHMNVMPEYLEYSEKDDKFRLITSGCHYGRIINIAKVLSVKPCKMEGKIAEWVRKAAGGSAQHSKDGGQMDTKNAASASVCAKGGKRADMVSNCAKGGKKSDTVLNRVKDEKKASLVFELYDGRNALERALLHFAHFEKEAERLDGKHYRVRVNYNKEDETELVIRVLSFGPFLRVVEPEEFVELIKQRLISQSIADRRMDDM